MNKVQSDFAAIRFLVVIALAFLLVFGGCDDFRNPDQIPAFLHLDYPIKEVEAFEGSASHRITEAYVYINDEFLGGYSFGRSYPFLNTGPTKVTVFFGIRMNNLDDMPNIYSIYRRYEQTIDLQPGRVDTISPIARYAPAAEFIFVEGFEGAHIFTEILDPDPETFMGTTTEVVKDGLRSGVLEVTKDNRFVEVATEDIYTNLQRGSPTFMELDFKGDTDLLVGLIGYDGVSTPQRFYKLQLFPRDEWRKVYVELSDEIFELRSGGYRFAFLSAFSDLVDKEVQRVYIDNVKLIQLK